MTGITSMVIGGNNELAADLARHAAAAGIAGDIERWQRSDSPLPTCTAVFIVADEADRAQMASAALAEDRKVVSLPIPNPNEWTVNAITTGDLIQVSRLHGIRALKRLCDDYVHDRIGRRYGIFAAHRLPRNRREDVRDCLDDLLVYVASLVRQPLSSVRVTTAALGGQETDAWFVLARFEDDTIATIEVDAVLPASDNPAGTLTIEATGSDAVLRAEPQRQSVSVTTENGTELLVWHPDLAETLLSYGIQQLDQSALDAQQTIVDLLHSVTGAAGADTAESAPSK